MKTQTTPLRQRQAEELRKTVLETVLAELESRAVEDLSMADVARLSGISLRTLYRYFPDRTSLLQAAGEYWYGSLGIRVDIAAPEDIAASFQEASRRLGSRPKLVRTLIRTEAGRVARSAVRPQRVDAIRAALAPLTAGLDSVTARKASALITYLCSVKSWVSIADESDLSDAEAQAAVAWAIDALIDVLRQKAQSGPRRAGKNPQ